MAGNWKMNLDHLQATHFVQKLDWTLRDGKHDYGAVEVAVLPPFTDLRSVQTLVEATSSSSSTAPRTSRRTTFGAYTGEISGAFLAKLGCTYVIVGHSERREYQQRDRRGRQRQGPGRVPARADADLLRRRGPRDPAGRRRTSSTCWQQLEAGLFDVHRRVQAADSSSPTSRSGRSAPVRSPRPQDAQEVCAAIRTKLAELSNDAVADGSACSTAVRSRRATSRAIMAQDDVDGALVGGASIDPEEFASICRYRDHL